MIKEFVSRFQSDEGQSALRAAFTAKHPSSYEEVVREVIKVVQGGAKYYPPDPDRIHAIDDGEYQGTLVFVIASEGYQPSDYWYVKVGYGSCSGCDTLESIRSYDEDPPTEEQVDGYMTLALHVVQGLKKMGDDE